MPSLEELYDDVKWSDDGKLFLHPPGQQHYRLLSELPARLNLPEGSRVLEIGTRWGPSAVALASSGKVHVTTCDLVDQTQGTLEKFSDKITFVVRDGYDMLDECHKYSLIFIDVDPHDGVQERRMVQKLIDLGYHGYVLFDDIHLNDAMQAFWDWIPQGEKTDLTHVGHYSGTGLLKL